MTAPDPTPTRDDLERAILGGPPAFDARQVAEATGVPVDQARRLWRALGFPEAVGAAAYTQADIDALRRVSGLVATDLVDFETALNLTRAVGQTMARLADWEVATLVDVIEHLESGEQATGSRLSSAMLLVDRVNGPFEELLVYVWRRHLAAAAARIEALAANDDDLGTVEVTVGFADMVAFTALSNQLDEDRIGDLVEVFESRCADVIATHGGRAVKSIGDSVLFLHETAEGALEIAEGIVEVVGRDKRLPDVRLGLATGSVVMRLGDVFGRPVNLAARLTTVARRNRIMVDDATAGLVSPDDFSIRRLPARPIRGFGLVEPLAVKRR